RADPSSLETVAANAIGPYGTITIFTSVSGSPLWFRIVTLVGVVERKSGASSRSLSAEPRSAHPPPHAMATRTIADTARPARRTGERVAMASSFTSTSLTGGWVGDGQRRAQVPRIARPGLAPRVMVAVCESVESRMSPE